MRLFAALLAAAISTLGFRPAGAGAPAELVMFDSKACKWCRLWDAQVGTVYSKTDEGRRLPLRRVEIGKGTPPDLPHIKGVRVTPTFVAVACGAEVGRIVGYGGEDAFYALLGELLTKLERSC